MARAHGLMVIFSRAVVLCAVALLALLLLNACGTASALHDDAFISFRYAANFAGGRGLVYNPGERVEGYTNPLYVLGAAAVIKAGGAPEVWMVWLGLLCGLLIVPIVYAAGRTIAQEPRGAWLFLIAPLLVLLNRHFCHWITGGLETMLFALLAAAALYRYLAEQHDGRRLRMSGVLFALCYLTRPDGALFFAAALIHTGLFPRIVRSRAELGQRARAFLPVAIPFLAIVGGHLLWRRFYYHAWLPNTFYAKTGGQMFYLSYGLTYLWGYLKECGGFLFCLAPIAYLLATGIGSAPALFLLGIALYAPFAVGVGGDYMTYHRLLAPLTPLLALLWQEGFGRFWLRQVKPRFAQGGRARLAGAGVVAAVALGIGASLAMANDQYPYGVTPLSPRTWLRATWPAFTSVMHGQPYWMKLEPKMPYTQIGRWLLEHCPSDTVIAVVPAGRTPYYSGLRTIDMLGLNDRHIARAKPPKAVGMIGHEKYDSKYVLSRAPEIILGHPALVRYDPRSRLAPERLLEAESGATVMADLIRTPGFWEAYRLVAVRLAARSRVVLMFVRRDVSLPEHDVLLEWAPGGPQVVNGQAEGGEIPIRGRIGQAKPGGG